MNSPEQKIMIARADRAKINELEARIIVLRGWLKDAMGWAEYCPECGGWLKPKISGLYGHNSDCELALEFGGE